MAHFTHHLMDLYGYYVLCIFLLLELLALPLPGEVLMTYTGLLVYQGQLNWGLSILTAWVGASMGMTISYWIGYKLGTPFFEKHGAKIHLGPEQLKKTSLWFERYGNKLLIIAYFIPGVRHFTGYFSGITRTPLRTFMIYAYAGAFIWIGTFVTLGKILGPKWEQYHHTITRYLFIIVMIVAIILIAFYTYKRYKSQIYQAVKMGLDRGVKTFHSFGKVKFMVLISFVAFLLLFIVMVNLIEDVLANELAKFDEIATYIVHVVFDERWAGWMNHFNDLSSLQVLLTIAVLTLIWIFFKGKDRMLEVLFLAVVLIGGELWDEGLRRLFHRTGPHNLLDTFPSEQTLITIIFLGFAAFLLVRHNEKAWIRTGAFLLVLVSSLLVGLSRVYFDIQYPSDVIAGYVIGGVWLSLNVVLLEVFRLLKKQSHERPKDM